MEFVEPIRDLQKIEAMKRVLRGTNMRDYCLFVLGINSALRISDLLKLTVGDVLNERGKPRERITLRETKTGKAKTFPFSKNAQKAVQEYLDTRTWTRAEPLFLSRKGGGHIQRTRAWTVLNDAARTVGIKDNIGTHTLRKTFAYHAYKAGYDLSILQQLLNHSSPGVTLRYIGITQDDVDQVYLNVNL